MYPKQFDLSSCSPIEHIESIDSFNSVCDNDLDIIQSFTPVEELWHVGHSQNTPDQTSAVDPFDSKGYLNISFK